LGKYYADSFRKIIQQIQFLIDKQSFLELIKRTPIMEGKKILITGGTGSLGQALTKRLLEMKVDTIRIFSSNWNNSIEKIKQI